MSYTLKTNVHGACACGVAQFAFIAPPLSIVNCHCEECRKASGAAFTTWVTVERSTVFQLPDEHLMVMRVRETGIRYRCKVCGTHVYSADQFDKQFMGFPMGVISRGLESAVVQANYCVEQRVAWLSLHDDLPIVANSVDFDPYVLNKPRRGASQS